MNIIGNTLKNAREKYQNLSREEESKRRKRSKKDIKIFLRRKRKEASVLLRT